jgi:Asp/Glu/hydantoin racemase
VSGPTIAMIHATPAAIGPAVAAFAEEFPAARPWHLMDDRLAGDADRAGRLTAPLRRRMLSLIAHSVDGGADGVLLTCSMYGSVTALARELWECPVAGSDEAMHEHVAEARFARIGLLASLESALPDSQGRLRATLERAGGAAEIVGAVAPGAAAAAHAGDQAGLLAALQAAAEPMAGEVDAILLCQYSLSGARAGLQAALAVPVGSPPHLAAASLQRRLAP